MTDPSIEIEIELTPIDGSDTSPSPTRWWMIVTLAVVAVAAVHIAAIFGNRGPVLYSDALGYLGNARFLAGGTPPTFDGAFSYAPGYSVLLIPLYWVTQQADAVWTGAVLLNVAFATLIMAPAYWLARNMFSLRQHPALLSAAVVSLTPALILQPGRIWTETLFPLVFLTAVAAVTSMFGMKPVSATRIGPAIASGALVGYLVSIHGRGIAVAAAFGAILLFGVVWYRIRTSTALIAATAAGIVVAGDLAVRSYLRSELWTPGDVPANAGSVRRILAAYAPDQITSTLSTALGHGWYVIAVSFGLAALGFVALTLVAARSPKWHPTSASAQAGAAFAILAVVGVWLLSAGLLTNVNRVDHRVYGRYLEGVTPILILAGTAALLKVRVAWRALGYSAALILPVGAGLYWLRGPEQFVGNVQKFTIPGLVGMQSIFSPTNTVFLDRIDVVAISVLATAIGIVGALAIRRNPSTGIIAVLAITVGLTFLGKSASWDPFVSFWYDAYNNVPAALNELSESEAVTYDVAFLNPDARNLYEFRLAPRQLAFVEGACTPESGTVVISTDDPQAAGIEGTPLTADTTPGQALWFLGEGTSARCR